MINAQDIKIGTCIRMDGKLYFCIDFLHVKPGKGNTFMRTKLKDVVNGYVLERRFNIGEKLEDVRVERRPHQYLYHDGDNYQFMNQETFDITILRAVHKYKDSREQFELRTHKRLIDIIKPSQKAVEALMGMELPAGVDIEIKL